MYINISRIVYHFQVFINNNTDVAQNLRQEFVHIHKGQSNLRDAVLVYLVLRCFKSNTIIFTPTKVSRTVVIFKWLV